jgi:D-arabinose 1-dehydrogenase-like Zn-dependent alcohol dehydrogenase
LFDRLNIALSVYSEEIKQKAVGMKGFASFISPCFFEEKVMRAMAVVDYAAPLELIDLPIPEAKPGFVLIRVLTCGVCYSDFKTATGKMPFSKALKLPHVPGHEICGEVAEATPQTGFQAGDRVIVYNYWACGKCTMCRMGLENLCEALNAWVGFTDPGGFEEYLAVPAERLLRLPAGITPEQAAPTSCAMGTSYRAVVTKGHVRPGQVVVIQGVGGLGLSSLQIARACGARVLAVDINRSHLDAAARLGAEQSCVPGEEAQALVRDFTSGLGADVVIDTVGHEESLYEAGLMARRGGRVVGIGYVAGGFARVQTDDFVLREIEFVGSRYVQRHELERAISLLASGAVHNVIDDVLPLECANEALARLSTGKVVGRTVLRVAA